MIFEQEYYTVHEEDAKYVAKTVFMTQSVIRQDAHGAGVHVNLTQMAMESLVRDLLLKRKMSVEIWGNQCNCVGNIIPSRSSLDAISGQQQETVEATALGSRLFAISSNN